MSAQAMEITDRTPATPGDALWLLKVALDDLARRDPKKAAEFYGGSGGPAVVALPIDGSVIQFELKVEKLPMTSWEDWKKEHFGRKVRPLQ